MFAQSLVSSSWQVSREESSATEQALHEQLALFNQRRLRPGLPTESWRSDLRSDATAALVEGEIVERWREEIAERAAEAPAHPSRFVEWFERLIETGPGQGDPLFPWLAHEASLEDMRWFVRQEVAGEAGFDDLVALTQVRMPTQAKLELARNYWDEMGRGNRNGMHGPMLARLAEELGVSDTPIDAIVWESLALGNLLVALAANRRYAYHALGALGAVELTAPGRAELVHQGLKRLGLSGAARRYYRIHSTLDVKHSAAWNREVIEALLTHDRALARPLAEGALMRLRAGERCFTRYRAELGVPASSQRA